MNIKSNQIRCWNDRVESMLRLRAVEYNTQTILILYIAKAVALAASEQGLFSLQCILSVRLLVGFLAKRDHVTFG